MKSQPLWVIFDGGNTDIKAMIHSDFGNEIVIPHSVQRISDNDFDRHSRNRITQNVESPNTSIFASHKTPYIVGEQARDRGDGDNVLYTNKYSRQHYGVMFEAVCLKLYPASHDDVRVIVLHPADLVEGHLKNLHQSIIGKHKITTTIGETITYTVTELYPIEEPVAGFQSFLLTTDGYVSKRRGKLLEGARRVLVLDVGGGLTSFIPCAIHPNGGIEPLLNQSTVSQSGIGDVMERLEQELKATMPEMQDIQSIPKHMLAEALSHDDITISGRRRDCKQQVSKAMEFLASHITQQYKNRFQSGVGYDAVIATGGGAGIVYDFINENGILNHNYFYPAEDDLSRMRFSNVRGASKGLIAYLATR